MAQYFNKSGKPAIINDYISYMLMKYGSKVGFEHKERLAGGQTIIHADTRDDNAIATYGWENISKVKKLFYCNPSQYQRFDIYGGVIETVAHEFRIHMPEGITISPRVFSSMDAVAILGHNLEDCLGCPSVSLGIERYSPDGESVYQSIDPLHSISQATHLANFGSIRTGAYTSRNTLDVESDGFSVFHAPTLIEEEYPTHTSTESKVKFISIIFEASDGATPYLTNFLDLSSIVLGHYYEFPHSPDMNVTKRFSYDGNEIDQSIGGHTFSRTIYSGKSYQWRQGKLSKSWFGNNLNDIASRCTYNLNFTALANNDLFPAVLTTSLRTEYDNGAILFPTLENSDDSDFHDSAVNRLSADDLDTDGSAVGGSTLQKDGSFYKNVIQYSMGNGVPFLYINNVDAKFPVDSNVFSKDLLWDNFSICRFASDSFNTSQTAHNLWNVSLSLEETF